MFARPVERYQIRQLGRACDIAEARPAWRPMVFEGPTVSKNCSNGMRQGNAVNGTPSASIRRRWRQSTTSM